MAAYVLPLILAIVACRIAIRSREAETRSKKRAMASLASGIAGFVPGMIGTTFVKVDQVQALTIFGAISILLGLAALVWAIWALLLRRHDHGVGYYYPLAGLLCGVLNLFAGSSQFATGIGAMVPNDGTPWTWRSEEHGFEVTIPSERWTLKTTPNVAASFVCQRPSILAIVAEVRPTVRDDQYEAFLAYGKKIKSDTPTSNTDERSEPNRDGHPHWVYTGDAKSEKGPYFFGVSVTRVEGKAVLLLLEGHYRMSSEAGHAQEARAFKTQADLFLGSVK